MKCKFFLLIVLLSSLMMFAADNTNGDKNRKAIDLTQSKPPKPARMIDEPVAEYNTVTGTLTITLDAVSYSEYTITLSSGYGPLVVDDGLLEIQSAGGVTLAPGFEVKRGASLSIKTSQ